MKEYQFYVVPTPIGNMADITLRAIETLKSVDIIACEDMRVTQKLLNHYDIKTKCISYHKFNEKERVDLFLNYIKDGKKIALVSDAGTPLICDPGAVIVDELRKNNIEITSLPGPNAVVTFLSQLSREDEAFTFIGFLPKTTTQIEEIIKKYEQFDTTFYESPNRIIKTLQTIQKIRPNCKIAIGRELTKIFEEILVDSIENVIKHFENNVTKGEFVCMIYRKNNAISGIDLDEKIKLLKDKNFKAKEISTILSELYNANKNDIYKRVLEI